MREGTEFDRFTLSKFWNKPGPQNVLNSIIIKEEIDAAEAIKVFVTKLDGWDSRYDLKIFSDLPTFDVALINYYIDFYLGRNGLTYKFGKLFSLKRVYCLRSFLVGVYGKVGLLKIRNSLRNESKFRHDPREDSLFLCKMAMRGGIDICYI